MSTKSQNAGIPKGSAVVLPCACANLRKAARLATQFYDGILRPSGMPNHSIHSVTRLASCLGISPEKPGRIVRGRQHDSTRTLTFLRRKGWLRSSQELIDASFGFF